MDHFNRKYKVNESFFSKINTQEKAYILGFVYADGCIYKNNLIINIHEKDIDVLQKMLLFMQSNYLIRNTKPGMVNLTISSKQLVEDLRNLGLCERKSKTIRFPWKAMEPSLYRHFVRGYFDGDGGVWTVGNEFKCLRVSFTSNPMFCMDLCTVLNNKDISSSKIEYYKHSESACLKIGKYYNIKRFYNFLYTDSTIFLDRKKGFFDTFFSTHRALMRSNNERRGVCFAPSANRWIASFKKEYLGRFTNKEEAIRAVELAEQHYLTIGLFD